MYFFRALLSVVLLKLNAFRSHRMKAEGTMSDSFV
jgi:hypothetical protein